MAWIVVKNEQTVFYNENESFISLNKAVMFYFIHLQIGIIFSFFAVTIVSVMIMLCLLCNTTVDAE